ncbi:MAG: glycosyltransferase [Planctomycetota bacterium]|nr:glycosyltransferase [Planctomycetota bacterium]
MHVLFVHQNFPAQFGHVAAYLVRDQGFRCTFVSERPPGKQDGIERIQYKIAGGATAKNHFCSRTFENAIWHTQAVFDALKARPDVQPDLIVGHSGFGSTLFLRELYGDCPIINYFEYFYRPTDSDMDFRPEFSTGENVRLRSRARNAMLLLDLENCDRGYSPTAWQRSRLPRLFHEKVAAIFDGIDTDVWKRHGNVPQVLGGKTIPDDMKLVTYVARGFESMRGFDIFMKIAKRLCDERRDVLFVVIGEDRVCYGGDDQFTGGKSFKEWVLSRDNYDLDRILFPGRLPPVQLARLLSVSDLHIYLTVPFVLSWSLMNSLACGAPVLASNTAPVQEMIQHEQNGLLADFYDVDKFVQSAKRLLDSPSEARRLGEAGSQMIDRQYSLKACLPQMLELYQGLASSGRS